MASQIATVKALTELIQDARAALTGAVRKELLYGIKTAAQFETLRDSLAVQGFDTCRSHGVHGSYTDFLICAVSINHQLPIFSLSKDFEQYR